MKTGTLKALHKLTSVLLSMCFASTMFSFSAIPAAAGPAPLSSLEPQPVDNLEGWYYVPIGEQTTVDSVVFDVEDQTLTVTGASTGEFWSGEDGSCVYVYTTLSGAQQVKAELESFTAQDGSWSRAGLMVRSSVDPGAAFFSTLYSANGDGTVVWNATVGYTKNESSRSQAKAIPGFGEMYIAKDGSGFTGVMSDGTATTSTYLEETQTIDALSGGDLLYGFAVSGRSDGSGDITKPGTFTAVFSLMETGAEAPEAPEAPPRPA